MSKLLGDAQKTEISEDTRKRRQVNSDQYDIRVINSDIPIEILDRMAEKAFRQHSPWKLMFLVVSHIVPARPSNHMGNYGDTAKLRFFTER